MTREELARKVESLVTKALEGKDLLEPMVLLPLEAWARHEGRLDHGTHKVAAGQACQVARHMAVPRETEAAYMSAWSALIATERYARAVGWLCGEYAPSSLMERQDIAYTFSGVHLGL